MKRKDLPFQPWGLKAIAEGKKTLTSRCSGLAEVNRSPDDWECCHDYDDLGVTFKNVTTGALIECQCPWYVGVDYNGVTVTAITAKRVQDITPAEIAAEGIEVTYCPPELKSDKGCHVGFINAEPDGPCCASTARGVLERVWDSIHRRDVNNRFARNPWTWRLSIKRLP